MGRPTSLTLLAFIAGTLFLVGAYRQAKGSTNNILNTTGFDDDPEVCQPNGKEGCVYTDACTCPPPPRSGYIVNNGFYYDPRKKKCVKSEHGLGTGCNGFTKKKDCMKQCQLRLNNWKLRPKQRN
uniref:Tissue factor pathway inhibitor n=1 Tax=Amblyomma americanum TaxID=6943 RepID=B5M708_AMBAM